MSDTVIRVENLGKKYIIGHQRRERYTTLRDMMAEKARSFGQMFRRNGKEDYPTHEEFWALKDVSFEIKQGDRVGIIGRNGAGKSTLLKILSRITEPTEGRISIKGRVASLLEVGTGFHPELTGRENIYLNGAILGMGKAEIKKKFDEIVAFAEVEKFLDTPVKRYSSGMYVRLAFAVAAHLEPEILIVDEVLAVGDAQFQKKCLGKMEDVGKEGRTVVFVSHNMSYMSKSFEKIVLFDKGRLVSMGQTKDMLDQYYLLLNKTLRNSECMVYESQNSDCKGIKKAYLKINNSADNKILRTGDELEIVINYSLHKKGSDVEVGFGILKGFDEWLFGCNNKHIIGELSLQEQGFYCCAIKIPSIPVYTSGLIYINLYLGVLGEPYQIIEKAFVIEAETIDYYETGIKLNEQFNIMVLPNLGMEIIKK
jgi:lipopolysaccharide transport system ATP-binding protein